MAMDGDARTGADICAEMLDAAKAAGAEAADALAIYSESLSADVRAGGLEQAERAEGVDVGIRVFVGRRQATVSASDASSATLRALAERAVAMARVAPDDPWCGLADPSHLTDRRDADGLDLADPAGPPEPAALETMAKEAEAAALAVDGVSQAEGAGASWSRRRIDLAASNGFAGGYARTASGLYVSAIAGEGLGMERDFRGESRRYADELPDAREIGRDAGERAVARLNPKRPPTGAFPVLYHERVASGLIGHLIGAANGAAVARGSSWLKARMGEQMLPKSLSVTERPLRVRGPASRPFDAEGLATRETAFVQDGVLRSWVLDLASARQLGLESTANAARGPGGAPSPSTTNLQLTQGEASFEDLMARMGTGLLVTSLIGASINGNTGDYSRGASGFWVEGGEIVHPVNEITIAGNLNGMLASIMPANDADPNRGAVVPSLLVEGLTVAGG
ncbi:MAG: TldD/PmbA family protein [Pseudomonadota bacterium]